MIIVVGVREVVAKVGHHQILEAGIVAVVINPPNKKSQATGYAVAWAKR